MPRIMTTGALVLLLSLLMAAPLQAAEKAKKPQKDVATLEQESREAYEGKNWVSFYVANMKLHQQRPYIPEYMYNIVRACALLDRKSNAYHYMLKMQKQGLSYDFDQTPDSENIRGTEAYTYLNDLMIEAGQPSGDGAIAFTLPGDPADYSVMEWDPSRGRFLVGTYAEGKLLAVADDGSTELLLQAGPDNGMWSINGIAVDTAHNYLWISSSSTGKFKGISPATKRHGALFQFSLDTLEPIGSYSLPVNMPDHVLGSVAVTASGMVYVIDLVNPIVYRKTPEGRALEAFVSSHDLVRLTDVAVSQDNRRLFVSDALMGVFIVDPEELQTAMLFGPEQVNLAGITGIEYAYERLFVTQSQIAPQRLLRLELDGSHSEVQNISPMATALEPFDEPGIGTISRGKLVYFANSGSRDKDAGAIVMATSIDAGSEVAPPEMDQFKDALMQQRELDQKQKQQPEQQ